MVRKALYVRLDAKPGFESKVEEFLKEALPLVEAEAETKAWFAIKMGPMTYGIFDAFPDDAGRDAHLAGKVAEALKSRAEELFRSPPQIEKIDVLAAKLP
ncbi:MAG: antibiotic biosynthesis monooxygenase [Fulvimarina sp.]|nr:antibiotic biosynthesis monooxygenase [Fulvimarina sp.]